MAKNAGTKGKRPPAPRAKHQAVWLREQIEKEHQGWNPVLEMVEIHHKERLSKRDHVRFDHCERIARFVQPTLKAIDLQGVGEDPGERSAFIVTWDDS